MTPRQVLHGIVMALFGAIAPAAAGTCSLASPAHRLTVLELYTSEGCNSCPPADRWLSSLPQRGITPAQAVLLAFHVDYWNELGWPDRFSQPGFGQRQRAMAARSGAGVVYTPQIVLDGRDLRAGTRPEDLTTTVASINAEKPGATIRVDVTTEPEALHVSGQVDLLDIRAGTNPQTWLAVFENGLSSQVRAGENAGKVLHHDFVVRDLAGPFPFDARGHGQIDQTVRLGKDWDRQRIGVAIFVQRRDTGDILQASALPMLCEK